MLLTWIFKGLVGVDGRRCMVEMNGNEADEGKWGSGVCVLNPREMGRCDLHCSSIGTAILFCDRLCLNQKTYYWKHKSSKQNITMNISPYAGIETTLRVFFFFFLAKFTSHCYWPEPRKSVWAETQSRMNAPISQKKYWSKLGQRFYSLIQFAYIFLRCSLLQPQI